MDVAESPLAVVVELGFIGRVGRDSDVQIMTAARREVAKL
jgi:hypothetical protein